jgi:xanthine/uracil permease
MIKQSNIPADISAKLALLELFFKFSCRSQSVTLVTGIGGLGVAIGSFSLQGISLCGVLAVLLNQILPPGEQEEQL